MTKEWVSLCLSRAVAGEEATILSELGCPMAPMTLDHHRAWYQEPHAGGLGWSFPAALGMQLADRDRLIVATMGDGSYMFANPVACHQIAEALALPILVVVVNNGEWGAVRQSVLGVYPDGYAARTNAMPLTQLSPVPDFTEGRRSEPGLGAARRGPAPSCRRRWTTALDHVRARRGAGAARRARPAVIAEKQTQENRPCLKQPPTEFWRDLKPISKVFQPMRGPRST